MKAKLIANDSKLLTMFRLGGIEGSEVHDKDAARTLFNEALKQDDLAVLILTTTVNAYLDQELKEHRSTGATPLVVVIDG